MSQVIIIAGMHRSGTSLVSSLLQRAGVHIGDRLLAANSANPRGYFEDADFYELHESLLHERNQCFLRLDPSFEFQPSPIDWQRAQQLVDARAQYRLWGWKDPRTSLMLEFWHQLLPDARFVFVYRHPLDVLHSLLRRGDFDHHPNLTAGLQAWLLYNSRIKSFLDKNAEKCLLLHIDGLVQRLPHFVTLLREKLAIELTPDFQSLAAVVHADELRVTRQLAEASAILATTFPETFSLYQQLEAQADIAAPGGSPPGESISPQLQRLAELVASHADPTDIVVRQSVLQLLLSSIAPQAVAKVFQHFQDDSKGCQQLIDWQWVQSRRLERINAQQQARLQERSLQIDRLLEERRAQATRIDALQCELDEVYQTRTWKLIQALSFLTRSGAKMNPCDTDQQDGLPCAAANSVDARLARLRQLHTSLRQRPVAGSFAALRRMLYKVVRSVFVRQNEINTMTADLIELVHEELQRDRRDRSVEEASPTVPVDAAPIVVADRDAPAAVRELTAAFGQTQEQVERNGVRLLQGFNAVYSSPAQLRMPERVALYSLILGLRPHNCVEIGTSRGGSSAIICAAMDDNGYGRLACVDPKPAIAPELWSRIEHRCRLFEGPPTILPWVAKQVGAAFDFALIDGEPAYDSARRDIAGVLPVLSPQAYVLVHDAHSPGVKKAIAEAVDAHPELIDCGLLSTEPTVLHEQGRHSAWAGLRLLKFERREAA